MKQLKVNVIRGIDKIGENLIEINTKNTSILLEYGISLEETEQSKELEKQVIHKYYDAIIITHSHMDHCGLLGYVANANNIYIGKKTYEILNYVNCIHKENIKKIKFLENEKTYTINDIIIKPYLCDHSATDSYMLEINKDEETVLYTGDYRSNGRKNFKSLLNKLSKNIDLLITEHTNILYKNKTEKNIEDEAINIMNIYKKIFILQSTLNIDRIVSFYKASKKTNKKYIMTKAQSDICKLLDNVPNPKTFNDCYIYLDKSISKEPYKIIKETYQNKLISKQTIQKLNQYTININTKMINYIKDIINNNNPKDFVLIYSLWNGYKENMKHFLDEIINLGIEIINLHVSGHADEKTINTLIKEINPKEVLEVHTNKKNNIN